MRLREQQLAFYRTFGFLRFPGLFAAEIDAITAAYERIFAASGRVHDHGQALYLIPFADRCEYLSALIDDPRIAGPVASILGSDYNYATSDGNYYVGDTMWHSDQHLDTPFHSVKVGFYLDPLTRDSGCLRLIPGSFRHGDAFADALHAVVPISAENRSREVWGIHGSEVPAVAIESQPGDMVLFNHKTKHSAWGGGTLRRMFTYNFEERMTGAQVPYLAQTLADVHARNGTIYGEAMLRTAGPERRRHLEQRLRVAAEHGINPVDGGSA